ncbi:MAG: hypothetical protein JW807_01320 [Spirochaetes bacterium]|nr:hypothetical protein [Spirochaetota bacterium]
MKRRVLSVYICLIASSLMSGLHARDINLDSIYIRSGSRYYDRLLEKKVEAYQAAHSQFVDRNVIFACWGDGFTLLYAKELPELNIIYSFNRTARRCRELFRLTGTITAFKNSASGKYLFVKRILAGADMVPRGETLVLNCGTRQITKIEPAYPFIDFSLAPGGDTILYESKEGIVEYFPETGVKRLEIRRREYASVATPGAPTIAYLSPNRKKTVVVSGSGGSYRSKIISRAGSLSLPGITSASEIHWIDNNLLVYRMGDAGNYSVNLYDTNARKSTLLTGNSLNTNIQFSVFPKLVAFLKDQVIHIYDARKKETVNTGLEGEDVSFSPDGNRFASLYLKKLFITGVATVSKKNAALTKLARQIQELYRVCLDSSGDLANEYSPEYIRKKIAVYRKMSD